MYPGAKKKERKKRHLCLAGHYTSDVSRVPRKREDALISGHRFLQCQVKEVTCPERPKGSFRDGNAPQLMLLEIRRSQPPKTPFMETPGAGYLPGPFCQRTPEHHTPIPRKGVGRRGARRRPGLSGRSVHTMGRVPAHSPPSLHLLCAGGREDPSRETRGSV